MRSPFGWYAVLWMGMNICKYPNIYYFCLADRKFCTTCACGVCIVHRPSPPGGYLIVMGCVGLGTLLPELLPKPASLLYELY